MILELHLIQNFAPANLNRDDTNAPKDAEFGGYRRARISSQAIKRAIRTQFKEGLIDAADLATRTKRLAEDLTRRLVAAGRPETEASAVAAAALSALSTEVGSDGKTKYLLYLGQREIDRMAAVCLQAWDVLASQAEAAPAQEAADKKAGKKGSKGGVPDAVRKELIECLDGGQAVDLALFGRMIADLPERNIDAASQVAHAISTHQVSMEFDFYTAVDDLKPGDTTGADMMGTVQFNSACFYRYANIDIDQLAENLGGDTVRARDAAEAFLRAAVEAIPTGKQNSMAAQNPPSLVLAVVRERGLWNLANAFVRPVRPDAEADLITKSIKAMDEYWGKLERMYGQAGVQAKAVALLDDVALAALSDSRVENLEALIARVRAALRNEGTAVAS